ncbi:TonB-dependent receptor [Rhodothermus marinus]|uniref:TonB-dependent receptor n=1 Tax=Rhodothermus marinus (strain ATCC 43812 / DSM 4252 / R-10) TaxID=518766 RepID=D0MGY8_RHOM4|nr:TonB-dependent receptor [Rhodothermus marinus]ACY47773.1 TonB-dependent receptor [Rhodothermus marinus DSM 4252]
MKQSVRTGLLVLILLVSGISTGLAQVLEGRVTDATTGAPLIGANVLVLSVQTGTTTDAEGRYRLLLPRPGRYRVLFSFVGYQPETREVVLSEAGPVRLDVALTPTSIEAPAVTITAKAQATDVLSTPQAVAVLEGDALRLARGMTAVDALAQTPGVHLVHTGTGIAKPMIRGLTAQRVLVVQDGIRQEGQQWGDEHGVEIDAHAAERIEVVKGPASLLYGSDALGGVVQLATEGPFGYDRPLTGAVTFEGASNTRMGGLHVEAGGRQGNWAYAGNLTFRQAGAYDTPRGTVPNTGLEERNGMLQLGYENHAARWELAYKRYRARIGFFEPEEDEATAETPDRYRIGEPYQQVDHDLLQLRSRWRLGADRLELNAAWQQNRRREFGHHHEADEEEAPHVDEHEAPSLYLRLSTLTSDLRFHHRPLGPLFGTIGLSGFFQRNETLAEEALIPGARTWNGAVYVFEELVLPRLTISGGVRWDGRRLSVEANEDLGVVAQTRTYSAFSGAVGLAWQVRPDLSLAFNVGRAWRAPTLNELFSQGVHEGTSRFEVGTPTLRPEQSLSLDGTLRWLRPRWYLELNAFVNRIDRFIFPRPTGQRDPDSGLFIYQYDQAQALLWGGELLLNLGVTAWLHLHVGGDVTYTENRETGQPLPFSPPPRLITGIEVHRERWGPASEVMLRLGPTLVADQRRVAPEEAPTEGYVLWNAAFSARWPLGAWQLVTDLTVQNLLDRAYVSHLSRLRPYGVLDPGRNVQLRLMLRLP